MLTPGVHGKADNAATVQLEKRTSEQSIGVIEAIRCQTFDALTGDLVIRSLARPAVRLVHTLTERLFRQLPLALQQPNRSFSQGLAVDFAGRSRRKALGKDNLVRNFIFGQMHSRKFD
jgi:hypothetical protein